MLGAIHNLSHSRTPFYPHPSLSFHSSSHSFSPSIPKLLTDTLSILSLSLFLSHPAYPNCSLTPLPRSLCLRSHCLLVTLSPCHFVPGHFVPSHFVPWSLGPSCFFVPGHIVPGHIVPGHIVPGHFVPRSHVPSTTSNQSKKKLAFQNWNETKLKFVFPVLLARKERDQKCIKS
jgi:hypothetical protein